MILKDLINKSYYGTIGHISKEKDLEVLNQYILRNFEILKEYKNIIVATNYSFSFFSSFSSSSLQDKNKELWLKYFPNAIIIDSPLNRGFNFGYTDLDNLIFDYCKNNKIQWLCKSANDTLLTPDVFNIEIRESDFYYLNGISYKDLYLSNFDYKKIFTERLFPQTNFYFINVDKVDFLNDKDYLDETYNKVMQIPGYSGKTWEYIDGWACELFLKNCVERNNLNKMYLLDETTHNKLCDTIKKYEIGDPAHKNLMINGICHYHYINEFITEI